MLTIEYENLIYQLPEKIFLFGYLYKTDRPFIVNRVYEVSICTEDKTTLFLLTPVPYNFWKLKVGPKSIALLNYIDYARFENLKAFV